MEGGLACGRTDSHLAPQGRGFRGDGPGAQGRHPSHCRALQECARNPTSISTQPPEGETRLQRLAGLRGRDRKKGKACLSQGTALTSDLDLETEKRGRACRRQKVGAPSQGGGVHVELEGGSLPGAVSAVHGAVTAWVLGGHAGLALLDLEVP